MSHSTTKPIIRLNPIRLGCVLVVVLGLLVLGYSLTRAGCSNLPGAGPCTRILFVGNSYTFVNDLPHTFADLARSGGHNVETEMSAFGSWTLSDHATSAETLNKLNAAKWNFVVLQEQSTVPAVEPSRSGSMYPAARLLVSLIKKVGAKPMFFMTWAHQQGLTEYGLQGYEAMQYQIDQGYLGIARELSVPIAPVGDAWFAAWRQLPALTLWQEDGSHPSEVGTYLAACVFYAAIFQQSPEGLSYSANLPQKTALALQKIAANTVLKDPRQWYLP